VFEYTLDVVLAALLLAHYRPWRRTKIGGRGKTWRRHRV
jgi:hypothetical protein